MSGLHGRSKPAVPDESPVQTLSSQEIKCGRFTIVQDRILVHGEDCPYDYVKVRTGVSILAFYKGRIALTREYRYPVRSFQYQLPSGTIDPGEAPEEAAIRELEEETGLVVAPGKLMPLGSFYPSFGATNEEIFLFAAECSELKSAHTEVSEVIELSFEDPEYVLQLVADGTFCHAAGLAALLRYTLRQQQLQQQQ